MPISFRYMCTGSAAEPRKLSGSENPVEAAALDGRDRLAGAFVARSATAGTGTRRGTVSTGPPTGAMGTMVVSPES